MRKLILLSALLYATAFVGMATPAHATNTRSFVASNGSDGNACTQAAPCLTFAHAITQTNAGGEIDCLTSGDYGPVTITTSITIDCGPGNLGAIEVPGTSTVAISINLSAVGVVILRNLSLNGVGSTGSVGIDTAGFPNGSQLYIQRLTIQGFTGGDGIVFSTFGARALMAVSDTTVNNNGVGINITANSGQIASAVFDGVKILGNTNDGLDMVGSGVIAGVLRHSVVAESGGNGVAATATGGVFFTVEESSIIDNLSHGILAGAAGVNLEVGDSTIGGNGTGVAATAGSIFSFGNNQVSANGANGTFTPGGPPLQ
jgi:hypothetical protein